MTPSAQLEGTIVTYSRNKRRKAGTTFYRGMDPNYAGFWAGVAAFRQHMIEMALEAEAKRKAEKKAKREAAE